MKNLLRFGTLGALLLGGASACYVHTKEVVEKPAAVAAPAPTVMAATCAQTVWVEGRYDNKGHWVPGYWGCARFTK